VDGRDGPRIVIVEDDEAIGANLARALTGAWEVEWVADGRSARTAVDESTSLVVLDLGLPDVDGVDLCQELTARWTRLPIIIVTARDSEIDTVIGLDAGAVDYLTKPVRLGELRARIRAHLRTNDQRSPSEIRVGPLLVDTAARRASVHDDELVLRPKEFDLLAELAGNAGRALERHDLMCTVWDEHWHGTTKTLDVHMAALRRKLEAVDSDDGVTITTLRGVGYRMEQP
jgi:DNA-binding response OmpR family regulator